MPEYFCRYCYIKNDKKVKMIHKKTFYQCPKCNAKFRVINPHNIEKKYNKNR